MRFTRPLAKQRRHILREFKAGTPSWQWREPDRSIAFIKEYEQEESCSQYTYTGATPVWYYLGRLWVCSSESSSTLTVTSSTAGTW